MTNNKNDAITEYVIFGKSVKEQFENKRVIKSNDVIIANALMSVAFYRIKDQRKGGWVCGTYTNSIKERIRIVIKRFFDEERATKLIEYCKECEWDDNISVNEQSPFFDDVKTLLEFVPTIGIIRFRGF